MALWRWWFIHRTEEVEMGRILALMLAALLGLGLISTSVAALAQDAYGGIHGNAYTTESAR
jgi:hypothetical protein